MYTNLLPKKVFLSSAAEKRTHYPMVDNTLNTLRSEPPALDRLAITPTRKRLLMMVLLAFGCKEITDLVAQR
jgi:hypothetical protein